MPTTEILRYTAFSADPAGGNPAGVVLDAAGLPERDMLAIASCFCRSVSASPSSSSPAAVGERSSASRLAREMRTTVQSVSATTTSVSPGGRISEPVPAWQVIVRRAVPGIALRRTRRPSST